MSKDASGDTWSADVPIAPDEVGTILYYITARDGASNSATDPISGIYSIVVTDNDAPLADAGPDKTGIVGEQVQFDGSGSTDNIGITSYSWDFGDGSEDTTGETASHVYSTVDSYTVTLTVRDAEGLTDTDTLTVTVTETPPQPTAHITIDMSREDKIRGRTRARATATLTVLVDGDPLNEANVYGSWSGSYGATVSGITNGEGMVVFKSGWAINGGTLTFTFTVTNVERNGVNYNLEGETSDTI
jgi:PKD repeat protein